MNINSSSRESRDTLWVKYSHLIVFQNAANRLSPSAGCPWTSTCIVLAPGLKRYQTFVCLVEMMFCTHISPWQATYNTIGPIKGAYVDSSAAALIPFRDVDESVGLKGSNAIKLCYSIYGLYEDHEKERTLEDVQYGGNRLG